MKFQRLIHPDANKFSSFLENLPNSCLPPSSPSCNQWHSCHICCEILRRTSLMSFICLISWSTYKPIWVLMPLWSRLLTHKKSANFPPRWANFSATNFLAKDCGKTFLCLQQRPKISLRLEWWDLRWHLIPADVFNGRYSRVQLQLTT